jgi:hypothetical protein
MLFRIKHELLGQHVHVTMYAGPGTLSLGNCGRLVFRQEEWEAFKAVIDKGQLTGGPVEFKEITHD